MIVMLMRVKFAKLKPIHYISHLELMATLRRANRRAGIPVSYSKGYNPHQKLALGQPLPVGMEGKNEYFDLELNDNIGEEEFVEHLNKMLPKGIELLKARVVSDSVKSLMAVINTAVYQIKMSFEGKHDEEKIIKKFMALPEIRVIRYRRNKDDRVIDLRPLIYKVELIRDSFWQFTVSTGSQGNIRPLEIVRALGKYFEVIKEVSLINIKREGLYVKRKNKLYEPYDKIITGSSD